MAQRSTIAIPGPGGQDINVGVLVPAVGINTTVAIPVAVYKVG